MRDTVSLYRQHYKIVIALVVLCASLMLAAAGRPAYAEALIMIYSSIVALVLFIGMVRRMLSGQYGVDILAVVAIVSTLVVAEYWATIVIVLMMLGGQALETFANARAKAELASLLDRAPTIAHKQMVDGSTRDVSLTTIHVRDMIVVRPGELVPVDGEVVMGESTVDESSLTGESALVEVAEGSQVMSGVVNGGSPLVVRATHTAEDSQYAQIVKLVKQAAEAKAPFVRLADRYAVPFTFAAFLIAGIAWLVSGEARRFAEVLVVATPCPLLIAAPVAMISGMSRSAKHGVIVKSGAVLEKLATVRAAAFDKTGTLTTGRLSLGTVVPAKGTDEEKLLHALIAAEQHSGHATAEAIRAYAAEHHLNTATVTRTVELPGGGVKATVDRRVVIAGKRSFLIAQGVPASSIPEQVGMTTYVAQSKKYIGCVMYEDTLRSDAKATIRRLRDLGVMRFVMLTGDKQQPAHAIARLLKLTDVRAECLPRDKVNAVKHFPIRPVMMVGDGVNDAPVLSASDVGVAMGARGATAASESADVVIMVDELSRLSAAIAIARRTMYIAKQSVLVGICISIALMIAAAFGLIPALLGAMLQEVVDVIVIVNALRAHHDEMV